MSKSTDDFIFGHLDAILEGLVEDYGFTEKQALQEIKRFLED